MRGHIVVAFRVMFVGGIAVRRPTVCECFKIAANCRVGVLGNDHRAAGVLREHVDNATAYARSTDQARDPGGDLRRAAAAGVNLKRVLIGQVCFLVYPERAPVRFGRQSPLRVPSYQSMEFRIFFSLQFMASVQP